MQVCIKIVGPKLCGFGSLFYICLIKQTNMNRQEIIELLINLINEVDEQDLVGVKPDDLRNTVLELIELSNFPQGF